MTDALRLEGVTRSFPPRRRGLWRRESAGPVALDGVTLEVERGGVTGIMGPSGSGKTTLLKIAGLLDRPSAGAVAVDSRPVSWDGDEVASLRRRIAMVFQKPVMFRATVAENVAFGLRLRAVPAPERDRRVREVLRRVGLHDHASRSARALSGGEQQRVAFARAVALDPEILLLDEFTAHLDYRNAAGLERLVRDYRRDTGATVLLATHSDRQARRLCDRVGILLKGRLVEHGTTAAVLDETRDARAREFLHGDFAL